MTDLNEEWDKFCESDNIMKENCMALALTLKRMYDSFIAVGFSEDIAYTWTDYYYQEWIFNQFSGGGLDEE